MKRRLGRGAAAVAVLVVAASVTACTADAGGTASPSADANGIPEAALAVMNDEFYANSRWQIYVEDLETGDVLVDYFGDAMAEPGSFVKTYSAAAAWLKFGSDSTVTTPIKTTGEVANGTLTGDLILVGQGDLTMGGRTKPDGSVDITNLDHNDANPIPAATLTPGLTTVQPDSEAAGKVYAKTGTLAAFDAFNTRFRIVTKTLGGVIDAESGRTLLFTVIMNNAFASPDTYIDAVFQANDDVGAIAAAIQQAY